MKVIELNSNSQITHSLMTIIKKQVSSKTDNEVIDNLKNIIEIESTKMFILLDENKTELGFAFGNISYGIESGGYCQS